MELNKINGNTYYMDNPTNVGVYIFKNKYCMLIDTGINNTLAGKFDELLTKNGIKPKYIVNTHNHSDHSGANLYFKEHYPGSMFFASKSESIFIENDYMFSMYVYGASPIRELRKRNAKSRGIAVDTVLDYGINKINEEKFEIISLKGHSIEQIGIVTPDRICFLGDGLFSQENMGKYPFPFLYDIEDQLETIDYIKTLDYDYYVLSHGCRIYNTLEIRKLADMNRQNIERFLEEIKVLLNQPLTREDLLEQIAILNNISLDFRDYYLCLSSVGAFISYLYNHDILSYNIENGRLYYYIK